MIQGRLGLFPNNDRRGSTRLKLSFGSTFRGTGDSVTIHDFSSTGMLIESATKLPLSDAIEIGLPEVGNKLAFIVWNSGQYYGCEFRETLPRAAISAALLRSQPERTTTSFQHRLIAAGQTRADETEGGREGDATDASDWEKASVKVRLRIILGSTIVLWALIFLTVSSLTKLFG